MLTRVQPDPGAPVTGYLFEGDVPSHRVTDPATDEPHEPATSYELPQADATDPYGEIEVNVVGDDEEHDAFQCGRNGQLNRFHSRLFGGPTIKWMNRVACGRQLSTNTLIIEHFLQPNMRWHNPTTFGSDLRPPEQDLAGLQRLTPSRLIPGTIISQGGATGRIAGCVNPLEFVPDNVGGDHGAAQDHGGDDDHPVGYHDHRHHVEVHLRVGGLENIHRVTFWSFVRRGRDPSTTDPVIGYQSAAVCLNDLFTYSELRTIGDATIHHLPSFPAATVGLITATNQYILADGDLASEQNVLASPFTGPYVAAVACIAATATPDPDEFCVVLACKLGTEDADAMTRRITQVLVATVRAGSEPFWLPDEDELPFQYLGVHARSLNGIPAGWVPETFFVVTCRYADVGDRLDALKASGLMDQVFDDLPLAATEGTEWPPGSGARARTMETITPSLNGLHEGAVAPGSGTGVRKHKAFLRSTQTSIANARPVGGASSAAVTTYTSLTLAGSRMNPPATLVAQVIQTSAAAGTLQLRVKGFDQFGERIVEETPVITIAAKTNNFIYLAKVFAYVDSIAFKSTGLDIADDTISIGTRWDWTRTVDATNAHTNGLNLGFGLPLRIGALANVAVTGRRQRYTRPKPVAAWATLSVPTNPANTHTVTIDGKVYTFKDTLTSSNGDVKIGASAAASVLNLYKAIMLAGVAGTDYGTGTTQHTTVAVLTVPTSTDLVVTAIAPGVLGNLIAVSETLSGSNNVWSSTTLEGGESDTGELLRITVRDVSGRSSNASNPFSTAVDGRRILLGYAESGWDCGAEKASILKQDAAPQWGGTAAVQSLTIQTNPSNGDTVTIGSTVYTFQTTLTNVDGNVKIGASAAASLQNLRAAINLMDGAGTTYAAAMTIHPTVFAYPLRPGTGLSGVLRVQAKTTGTGGNSIASTETMAGTGNAWGAATLAGGAATLVDVTVEVEIRTRDNSYSET